MQSESHGSVCLSACRCQFYKYSIHHSDIAVAAAGAFGLLGMIVGRSLARNLWLVSGIASAVVAGSLAREEEGGALSDVVRAVGFEVALKARQFFFMYRTGRLSYVYFKKVNPVHPAAGALHALGGRLVAMPCQPTNQPNAHQPHSGSNWIGATNWRGASRPSRR
jgi:hypothetical protein